MLGLGLKSRVLKPSCVHLNEQVGPFVFAIKKHRLDRNQRVLPGSSSAIVSEIQGGHD